MQLTITDNYLTMIELLAGLVKHHLDQPPKKPTRANIDKRLLLLVSAELEKEDEDFTDWEMTVELLGSHEFRKIA